MKRSSLILLTVLISVAAACGVAPVIAPAPAETGVRLTDAQAASCRAAFRVVGGYGTEMIVYGYRPGIDDPAAYGLYADQRVREFGAAFNAAAVDCPLTSP